MDKIVSFRKEIPFNTNIYEVTSISLEHTIDRKDEVITGSFIVSGEYKVTEVSIDLLPYNFEIPFTIDTKLYDTKDADVVIDDFYYEIFDNKTLIVNIDVKLINIKDIPIERCNDMTNEIIDALDIKDTNDTTTNDNILNISNDNYVFYKVYIVRSGDTIDSIIGKYNVSKELIESYNDLSNINVGDKIIIPYEN